jgi:hypothetical protein
MKFYSVLLTLFIFGFVTSGINESGMFHQQLPATNLGLNQAIVQEVGHSAGGVGIDWFSAFTMLFLFIKVFISAAIAVATILPILSSWGVPLWAGMMVQGPLWFVEIVGFYGLATGHMMLGME